MVPGVADHDRPLICELSLFKYTACGLAEVGTATHSKEISYWFISRAIASGRVEGVTPSPHCFFSVGI